MDIAKPKAVLIDWEGTISGGNDLFPYMEDLLYKLKKNNVYVSVVSNMNGDRLRNSIERRNLNSYFAKVVGFGDCAAAKPNTEPVYEALNGSGIEPSLDVFFIGDSQADIVCALNSGCRSLFLNADNYPEYMLRNCMPHHIFKNHKELWNFMDNCLK